MGMQSVHESCTAINSTERELLAIFRQLNEEDRNLWLGMIQESVKSQNLAVQLMEDQGCSKDEADKVLLDMAMAELDGVLRTAGIRKGRRPLLKKSLCRKEGCHV